MFARGFLGVVPTKLIEAIAHICKPQDWKAVYVACSGTFRTERGLFSIAKELEVRSNDVSLLSTALGQAAIGQPLPFRFVRELEFVEELQLTDPVDRIAAILLALDYSSYVKGKQTRFKAEHVAHLKRSFGDYVREVRPRVEKVVTAMPLAGYYAGDFRDHIEAAIERGAGVIAYPPTFKGGYEKLFQYVDDNTEWQRPSYRIYDPKADVGAVLQRLASSGIPYFLYLDQEVEGFEPQLRYEQPGKRTIFGYGRPGASSYRAPVSRGQPFAYQRLELDQVKAESKLWVMPAPEPQIAFLREAFLSKRIAFGSGDYSVKVYIDEMLLGAISYRKPMGGTGPLFVLTDMVITREGRLAKLVARLATNRAVYRPFENKLLTRFAGLSTTAFSTHPEAMKYRGSWKVAKREGEEGAFKISYASEPRTESLDECFAWWWKRDGEKQVAAARSRTASSGAEGSQAA